MEMSSIEKLFVNREAKGRRNIAKLGEWPNLLGSEAIVDVLEIGAGIGTVSAYLAETRDMNVTGTDFDPGQVELARARYPEGPHLHFAVEDANELTFPDSTFDLVVAHNVLHHLPDWEIGLAETHRVLREGGYLDLIDLEFASPIRRLLKLRASNESFFSLDEIRRASARLGFQERFHKRTSAVLIAQHHFVLQRV